MQKYDCIVVGSGFYGAVVAERLRSRGQSVLVLERRDHIGGNSYSYDYENTGINVHCYGTHIFHTDNQAVWDYVNRFGGFNRYEHRVRTTHKDRVYSMPINLGTINAFYGVKRKGMWFSAADSPNTGTTTCTMSSPGRWTTRNVC